MVISLFGRSLAKIYVAPFKPQLTLTSRRSPVKLQLVTLNMAD